MQSKRLVMLITLPVLLQFFPLNARKHRVLQETNDTSTGYSGTWNWWGLGWGNGWKRASIVSDEAYYRGAPYYQAQTNMQALHRQKKNYKG